MNEDDNESSTTARGVEAAKWEAIKDITEGCGCVVVILAFLVLGSGAGVSGIVQIIQAIRGGH